MGTPKVMGANRGVHNLGSYWLRYMAITDHCATLVAVVNITEYAQNSDALQISLLRKP